ncbi:hypothetical protein ACN6A1_03265 [Myxococcus virescens]|uniref:hypothetical protein n=1 Tax=Myxococcus virescens TaxID=83456 RepID=UPI003DA69F38
MAKKEDEKGEKQIKHSYRFKLAGVALANFALYYLVVSTDSLRVAGLSALFQNWKELVPGSVALVLTGALNSLLDSTTKARLVFWKWKNPLPGTEAFSKHAKDDPRINVATLKARFGPLPRGAYEQNSLWYKMYSAISSKPAVMDAHVDFLVHRDYACIGVLFLVAFGIPAFFFASLNVAGGYLAMLLVQCLLAMQAARNSGVRLVTTVLAIRSAEG